ncbi:MAG: hypothetical protein AAGK66_08940, partial [Pseudomonadota bacterium]
TARRYRKTRYSYRGPFSAQYMLPQSSIVNPSEVDTVEGLRHKCFMDSMTKNELGTAEWRRWLSKAEEALQDSVERNKADAVEIARAVTKRHKDRCIKRMRRGVPPRKGRAKNG